MPCVFVDDAEIVRIEVQRNEDDVFLCNGSLALLRGQLLLEALGHLGRRRPRKGKAVGRNE